MSDAYHCTRCIGPGHPSLAGHFPGRPVVPGVLLLEEVLAAIEAWRGTAFVAAGFPQVKFLAPLLPGQDFSIRLRAVAGGVDFECHEAERLLLRGQVRGVEGRP